MTADPGPIGTANIGAACAIFDSGGRILLVRHTYGKLNWEIPGGICLPDEAPSDGAARELQEETGLHVSGGSLSGVYYERQHWSGAMVHFVFRFTPPISGRPAARPPEIGDVGWFALDDLPRPISDFTEQRARDALGDAVAYRIIDGRDWRE
jgi:8-oxo-dGTP pyrophosphatase MutT (NUDIX family)